jgi:parvulin-like peptidyl-prolyl isomerase
VGRAGTLGLLALVTLAAAACGRCGGGAATVVAAGPRAVAVVNGEPITAEALSRELRQIRAGGEGEAPSDPLRKRVLDDLVDRVLLLQQARARSIAVSQDQVERAFLRVRGEYPGTHFDDLLARERLSQAELKGRLKDQLTVERLFHDEVFPRIAVAPADVERWYAEHPAEFGEPERVRVLQVVVSSRDEAATLRDKLRRDPSSFAEVARASSIAPEGKNGGELGWIGRGSGFPEVFDVCFTLPLNAISEVTPSPDGHHLVRVVEKRPAQRRPLEKAGPEIREKLLRQKRAQAQAEYVAALRQRAQITFDEKAIASVTP